MKVFLRKKSAFFLLLFTLCLLPVFSWGDSSDDSDDDDSIDSSWDFGDDDGDDSDCFDWSEVFDDSDDNDDEFWTGDELDNMDNYHGDEDVELPYASDFDFGDEEKKTDDGNDSLENLVSHYEEAKAEVQTVLEGEKQADPIEFAQLQEAVDEAKAALDAYCASHDYTYTENAGTGAVSVYNADGQVVNFIGDPVMLATGIFRLEDKDMCIRVGKTEFGVARRYESVDFDDATSTDGAFGSLWTSILNSRIILGCHEAVSAEVDKWQQLVQSAQSALEIVQSYAEEDTECEEFALQVEEILAERIAKRNEMQALADSSAARAQKNVYTGYGYGGQVARNLGLNRLIFVDDQGNPIVFEEKSAGYENEKYADRFTLSYEPDADCYLIRYKSGEERLYNGYGLLQTITFPNGGIIVFDYDNQHQLAKVSVNGLRTLTFTWSGGHVASVFDGMQTVSYGYDGNRLVTVQDGEGDLKSYAYDAENRLVRQIKSDGSFIEIGYEKDAAGKMRTTYTVNENGAKETFSYDIENRRTCYLDHDGVQSTYEYDSQNRTVKESYADGRLVSYGYDTQGRLAWCEKNGNRETYSYDSDGHMISVACSDASSIRQTYSGNNLISYADRDGVVTSFDYDSRGNNTAVWRGGEKVWSYTYNALNLVTEARDCYGNRAEFLYDSQGNLIQKKIFAPSSSSALSTEGWLYDAIGRVIRHTLPSGMVQTYRYEPHLVFCSQSNGFETELRYSNRKDLIYCRQKDMMTGEERIYRYEYDKCHKCVRSYLSGTDGNGKVCAEVPLQSNLYSGEGRLLQNTIWNTQESGWACQYEYNGAGQIASQSYGMVGRNGNFYQKSHAVTFQSQYTSEGLVSRESNGDGRVFLRRYDPWERLVEVRAGDLVGKKNRYSPGGRLLQSLTALGGEIAYEYDQVSGYFVSSQEVQGSLGKEESVCYSDGKKAVVTNPLGAKTYYYYDAQGNLCRLVTDGKIEEWQYDGANRLTSHTVSSPDGRLIAEETLSYSADCRTVNHVKGGRFKKIYRVNAFGEILSVQDGAGNTEHFIYDLRGRCVESYDAYEKRTRYIYDGKDRLVQTIACNGTVTNREYDFDGNCISISDASGVIYEATYDRSGRLVSKKENPSSVTEKYSYDDKDRITKILRGDKAVVTTEYGEDGKSFTRIDAKGGASAYQTDGFGRILKETNRLGFFQSFAYRLDGSLSALQDYEGKKTACSYDRAENKVTVSYADGSYSEEIRDAAGNILSARNDSSHLRFTYDTAGHMLTQQDVLTGQSLRCTYDDCGRRVRLQSEKQDVTYRYGKRGELTEVSDRMSGLGMKFVYDDMGREILRLHSTGESQQSVYDEAGRLLLTAAYSAASNLISVDGAVYGSHGERRLSLNADLTVTSYRYDNQGRLSAVQYPYSQALASYLKKLCEESGEASSGKNDASSSILSLSSEEYDALRALCAKIGTGLYQPRINESMLEERFFYDANGNLSRRETPFGTISYEYDGEDRLLAWGSAGSARYDANGNLLQKRNLYKSEDYAYTVNNRMKSVSVQDLLTSEIFSASCRYDAFGRRIQTDSSRTGRTSTVYDGLSFNDLYAVRSAAAEGWEDSSPSMRYTYIDEQSADGRTRTIASRTEGIGTASLADSHSPLPVDAGYTLLYGNSRTPAALSVLGSDSAEDFVFFSDAVGTLKTAGKNDGTQTSFFYDVFGAPLSLSDTSAAAHGYGFAGKKTLDITSLYDFGYRDYSPASFRFTTSDPARDGPNWYTYCGGDPVNWVDKLGLENVRPNDIDMHDSRWGNDKLGDVYTDLFIQLAGHASDGKSVWTAEDLGNLLNSMGYDTIATAGCVVSGIAEIINVLTGADLTPKDVNDLKSNFKSGTDLINFVEVAKNYNLDHDYWTKGKQGDLSVKIDELDKSSTQYAILAEVFYSSGHTHWVGIDGGVVVRSDGKSYVAISATSANDKTLAGGRSSMGWVQENGKIYVPTSQINTLQQYSNNSSTTKNGKEDANASKNQ